MKWLFTFIMILLLCISRIKFLRLSIFSKFIGHFISFLSFEYIFIHIFIELSFLLICWSFYFSNSGHLSSIFCIANIPPIFSLLLISFPVFLDKYVCVYIYFCFNLVKTNFWIFSFMLWTIYVIKINSS